MRRSISTYISLLVLLGVFLAGFEITSENRKAEILQDDISAFYTSQQTSVVDLDEFIAQLNTEITEETILTSQSRIEYKDVTAIETIKTNTVVQTTKPVTTTTVTVQTTKPVTTTTKPVITTAVQTTKPVTTTTATVQTTKPVTTTITAVQTTKPVTTTAVQTTKPVTTAENCLEVPFISEDDSIEEAKIQLNGTDLYNAYSQCVTGHYLCDDNVYYLHSGVIKVENLNTLKGIFQGTVLFDCFRNFDYNNYTLYYKAFYNEGFLGDYWVSNIKYDENNFKVNFVGDGDIYGDIPGNVVGCYMLIPKEFTDCCNIDFSMYYKVHQYKPSVLS